ncbi:MAG TPA: tetratricopeptide repeat protein [Casimicrobiaceae bacterium]|jgi:predicted O-linked N-acetylglucosamine transferase (SPINDLY family)
MTTQRAMTAQAIQIGLEHHHAGRIAEAATAYRQVLSVEPDNFDALHLLGVAAHQSGDHAEAVELIEKALYLNPSSTAALNNLGEARRALGDADGARACFQEALRIQPDYFDAINNLGNLAQKQGRLDEALRSFEHAARLSPGHAGVHHNLGLTRHRLGALPEAMQSFRDAWIRDPMLFAAAEQMVATAAALARTADRPLTMPQIANASQPSLVSIVLCSIDDQKHARIVELYRRLYAGLPHEITVIRDAKSLAEAYNRGIARSSGEVVVLSHDDVDILAADFAARLQRHLQRFDIIGVMGAAQMSGPAWGWSGHPNLRGWITHHAADAREWFVDIVDPRSVADDTVVLDGVFLAARRSVFDAVRFDAEAFDGFHLYDIDWSYRAAMAGFSVAVAGDLLLVHESRGSFDPEWQRYAERFCNKHAVGEKPGAPYRQVFEAGLDNADQVRDFFGRLAAMETAVPEQSANASTPSDPDRVRDHGSLSVEEKAELSSAFKDALQHHKAGRLAEAGQAYQQILAVDPEHFDALHLSGVIAHQDGRYEEAVALMERAVLRDPTAFPAFNNLGLAYRALGHLDRAGECFARAVDLGPEYVAAHNNLGLLFHVRGRFDEAVTEFRRVLSLKPDFAEAHYNLGVALQSSGNADAAIASYRQALTLNADFAEAYFQLARALEVQGKTAEALAGYQEALLLKPDLAEAHFFLGSILQDQGMIDDALECFSRALSLKPDYVEAHWALAMSQLALVYGADDDPEEFRSAFSRALSDLDFWFDATRIKEGYKAVGSQQPFFLAYQEMNNRELLSQYGDLCARLMKFWQDEQGIASSKRPRGGKVRLGIISAHVHDQSVWTAIVKGWCEHLDCDRISLHIFHTGSLEDEETASARSRADYFLQGPGTLRQWVDAVVSQQLDVIIYPEIGMHPMTAKLANLRLAPVQAVAWGHPETSGLPTVDYYLSAEDFEPPEAQENYRERLVALPHLGCFYHPLEVDAIALDLDALGIDSTVPLLLCPGTPVKYTPEHDWMFVEIARRLGRCQFIFFNHFRENLSEKLQRRLDSAFAQADMYFSEHAISLPWLNSPAFFGLLRRADVFLDTIGFSGFNTAMQGIECGLPIVAREGRFMRGRLASGIVTRLGLSELVAKTDQEYVDLAVKLGQDAGYRDRIHMRIEASRHLIFDDIAPVRALEDFLIAVTDRT